MYVSGASMVVRYGTVINGTQNTITGYNFGGDNGTVTPTAGTATAGSGGTFTKQFPCYWSNSYRSDGTAKWRTTNTQHDIFQGGYGTDLYNYGTMLFATDAGLAIKGAGGTQIPSGSTILSARLYIKRYNSSGSSSAMAWKLYACTNTDISLAAIPTSGQTTAKPTLNTSITNNYTVASLAWGAGGWYSIPAVIANEAFNNGRALCFYTSATTPYGRLYESGSAYEPILEITYQ